MAADRYNERADVARRILELSDTIDEAIDYMLSEIENMHEEIGVYAAMLKEVGEGLISLDNASTAISGPMGADPETVSRLAISFDDMCIHLDAMADACLEDRISDLPGYGKKLRESFTVYSHDLTLCFRSSAVM